jgi:hypothetical protein
MEQNIKLIWDFRGPAAAKIAEHHAIHLGEFVTKEGKNYEVSHAVISEMHAIAYFIVPKAEMIAMRDALRPHRGELVEIKT